MARLKEKNHSSAFPRIAAVVFGVCLVESTASLIESFERSGVGPYLAPSEDCRQRLPSTAGIVVVGRLLAAPCGAYVAPAPPIYKLEASPADGMSAAAAEWWGLRHAPVGSSAANLRCFSVERKRPITPKPLRNAVS